MNASSDAHGAASLREYMGVVRRRKWIILQAVVLVPLVALVYSLHKPVVYSASSQVLLSGQDLSNALSGVQSATSSSQDSTQVATQAQLASVPQIARRAIAQLGSRSLTPGEFLADCWVTSGSTNILTFHCSNGDPALAARMVNQYAVQYVNYRRQLDTNSLESARREVESKIQQLHSQGEKGGLYATLVEREQELQTMEELQTANATVVQTSDGGARVSSNSVRNVTSGLILGLLLGIGLAFLREALDTRVRNGQEIAERLGLPLLGRLPEPPKELRADAKLVMLERPSGTNAEAFRVLRTNLEFSSLDRDVRSVLITSAVEQEGKSTTIANLAVALARSGQRVILVDLDLRRPFIAKFFRLADRPGLTQVVLGHASLEKALTEIPLIDPRRGANLQAKPDGDDLDSPLGRGQLRVLGAGPIPPAPGEFVSSDALGLVLDRLEELADIVLVDSPPLLQVGDAMVLSAKVDAVILVARMERLRRPMLNEVQRLLSTAPSSLLGFVVTGAEAEEGYGYGYGYGYASQAEQSAVSDTA